MIQEKQLRHDHIRNLVIDRRAKKNNPLFEQERVNVISALAAACIFNNHRYYIFKVWDHICLLLMGR